MRFGIIHYWKPTPLLMRKIGDSMLAVSTFAAGYSLIQGMEKISFVLFITGAFGKFLSNFFGKSENDEKSNPQS